MVRRLLVTLVLVLATGSLFATDHFVQVGPGMTFTPNSLAIVQGDTVTWQFAEGNHTTTSDANSGIDSWDSGVVAEGGDFQKTFFTTGNFPYHCAIHSSAGGVAMNGTITVDGFPSPTVTGMSPTSGPSAGGTTVTLTGTNFTPDCQVDFGGTGVSTVSGDSNTLVVVTPPMPAGFVDVTVNCLTGTASAPEQFEFLAPPAEPFVSGFSPPSGPTTGGTTVTVTGSNFVGPCSVDFGGFGAATTFVNSGTLQAVTPAFPNEGFVDLNVTCANGTATAADTFQFVLPATNVPLIPTASETMLVVLAAALALCAAFVLGRR